MAVGLRRAAPGARDRPRARAARRCSSGALSGTRTGGAAAALTARRPPGRADLHLRAPRPAAVRLDSRVAAREGGRDQLLGLVVRPCKEEAPLLEPAGKQWRSKDVVVVGVDANDFQTDARRSRAATRSAIPIVHDGRGRVRRRLRADRASRRRSSSDRTAASRRGSQGELEQGRSSRRASRGRSRREACSSRSPLLLRPRASQGRPRRASRSPTLAELESEVICPTCHTTLDQSHLAVAEPDAELHPRAHRGGRHEERDQGAGSSPEFGEQVLASPPKRGFNLLAWVLPPVAVARRRGRRSPCSPCAGAAGRDGRRRSGGRRSARRSSGGSTTSSPASTLSAMAERIPIAFLAGVISVITPCVLPLVPGYLRPCPQSRRTGSASGGRRAGSSSRASRSSSGSPSSSSRSARERRPSVATSTPAAERDRRLPARRARPRVHGPAAVAGAASSRPGCSRAPAVGLERAARRRLRGVRRALHRHRARLGARARRRLGHGRARARCCSLAYSAGIACGVRAGRHRVRARDGRVPLAPRPLQA